MRISDWSSDVCSSDLLVEGQRLCRLRVDSADGNGGEREQGKAGKQVAHRVDSAGKILRSVAGGVRGAWATGHGPGACPPASVGAALAASSLFAARQAFGSRWGRAPIGRASGRERGGEDGG